MVKCVRERWQIARREIFGVVQHGGVTCCFVGAVFYITNGRTPDHNLRCEAVRLEASKNTRLTCALALYAFMVIHCIFVCRNIYISMLHLLTE